MLARLIDAALRLRFSRLKRCRTVFWLKTFRTFSSNRMRFDAPPTRISCESSRSVVASIGVRPRSPRPSTKTVACDRSDVGRQRRAAADVLIQANLRSEWCHVSAIQLQDVRTICGQTALRIEIAVRVPHHLVEIEPAIGVAAGPERLRALLLIDARKS